jgi:hypothetical protein
MKTIAFTKAWKGGIFADAAIRSIYEHVDKVVIVESDYSWLHMYYNGRFSDSMDHYNNEKVIIYNQPYFSQIGQYDNGVKWVINDYNPDKILFFDLDEVWEKEDLDELFNRSELVKEASVIKCNFYNYIKSPLYRINPYPGIGTPVLVRKEAFGKDWGVRFCNTPLEHKVTFDDLLFHHFTYVCDDESDVFQKIIHTFSQERQHKCVDLVDWAVYKWGELPRSKNLFTVNGKEHYWPGVDVIKWDELPFHVREDEQIKSRWKDE